MSNPIDIAQEYLVSLGFKVNNTQLNSMIKALDDAKSKTSTFAGKMTKNLASSGVAIISFIASATVATAKFVETMADADMETEKLARRMWITEESARSLQNTLSAMGEDLGSLNDIAMNEELRGQFTELYNLSKQLGAPEELQDQLKLIRSITFEFKKFKLIANYTMQNVGYYLMKYFGTSLGDIKNKLSSINNFIIKNMPKISKKIATGLYTIIRLGETLFMLVYRIGKAIFDFLDRLPTNAKIALGALAALGVMALNPFTMMVGAMLMLLLLMEDYYSYSQGKKSLLGGMWGNMETIGGKISEVATEVNKLFESLTGISVDMAWFEMFGSLVEFVANGLSMINDELDLLANWFEKSSSEKIQGLKGVAGKAFEISEFLSNPLTFFSGKLGRILGGAGKAFEISEFLSNPLTFFSGKLGRILGGGIYSPNGSGNTSNKTSNLNVEINQNIRTDNPVLAAKQSSRYISESLNRSVGSAFV